MICQNCKNEVKTSLYKIVCGVKVIFCNEDCSEEFGKEYNVDVDLILYGG